MSVISGIYAGVQAGEASEAQQESADKATKAMMEMFYQSRTDTGPWRAAGETALNALVGSPGTPAKTTKGAPIYGSSTTTGTATTGTATGGAISPDSILTGLQQQGLIGPYSSAQTAANSLYESGFIKSNDPNEAVNYLANYVAGQSPEAYSKVQSIMSTAGGVSGANNAVTGAPVVQPGNIIGYEPDTVVPGTSGTTGLLQKGPGEFKESPGYQFRLTEGVNALDKSAAAKGRLMSGAHEKAVTEFGQDYASNEYDKFLNQYYQSLNPWLSLAGMGQISAGNSGSAAIATGSNISENALYSGNARASGYINQANALTGASRSAVNSYPYISNALKGGNYWNSTIAGSGAGADSMTWL